jgi:hypothetical protein
VCKKEGVFNPIGLKPTNILTMDPAYYNVYNFFVNYLNKEPTLQTEQGMYLGYVTVNLFCALDKLGFKVSEETSKIGITNSGALRFPKVEFSNDLFRITLTQEENALVMNVKAPDDTEGRYLIKALSQDGTGKISNFTTLIEHLETRVEREDVEKTITVNSVQKTANRGAVYVKAELANTVEMLEKALKSFLMVGVGSHFMYSRYCPVCGSNLIGKNEQGMYCSTCESTYHLFMHDEKQMVWFKNLPEQHN